MAKLLSSLPVGAVVKDATTLYNGKPILWKVMEHGHSGDPSGSTALVTKHIISLKSFDALEASNSDSNRRSNGNNRYSVSNMKSWLNSEKAAGLWYSAQHSADAAPTNANVWSNYNEYDQEAGFLYNFSANMKNALIETTRKTVKNTVTDGASYENVASKIFLLSTTEVGLANENSIAEGSTYSLFNTASERIAYPTAEAVAKSEYTNANLNASKAWYWWLRTPYASYSNFVRNVDTDGSLTHSNAINGYNGVRPACVVSSSILVSDNADTDGAYTIQWNAAPTLTPESRDYGSVSVAPSITISVSDSDGDTFTATVKVDGATKDTYTGTASGTYELKMSDYWREMSLGQHTITVNVIDGFGNCTENTYSLVKTNEAAPMPTLLNLEDGMRRDSDFYVEFSVGEDPEGDTQSLEVQVADDSSFSINKQEFRGVEKYENGAWAAKEVISNEDAGARLRIKVTGQTDGQERYVRVVTTDSGSSTAVYTTSKRVSIGSVLEVGLHPMERSSAPNSISVLVDGNIDANATTQIYVSNNASDENPVWEEYTAGTVHSFANKTKTATSWAVSAKILINANDAVGEIAISTIVVNIG